MTKARSSDESSAPQRRAASTTDSTFSRSESTSVPSRSKRMASAAAAVDMGAPFDPGVRAPSLRRERARGDDGARLVHAVRGLPQELRARVAAALEVLELDVDGLPRRHHDGHAVVLGDRRLLDEAIDDELVADPQALAVVGERDERVWLAEARRDLPRPADREVVDVEDRRVRRTPSPIEVDLGIGAREHEVGEVHLAVVLPRDATARALPAHAG